MDIYGKIYTLNQLPTIKKVGIRKYEYTLTFEGVQYELIDVQWLLPNDTVLDSFTGDLDAFINILIDNANRVFPGTWAKGTAPADTETKTLTYIESNCLEVLQKLCEEYETEFEIAQRGGIRTINIKKAGEPFPYTFSYGRTGGLYELSRQNINAKNVVTRLYVYGGTNNLGSKYRYSKLCLPLKNKNASFIENPEAVAAFGVKENTKVFEKIFPKRIGEVTGGGSKYYSFTDNTMNFDLNEKEEDGKTTKWLINGVSGKIKVTTGNLAGYEFEIHKYDNETKEIQVVPFTDENGMKFPSETSAAFQFKVGDKYIFTDINLPDAYKTEAEEKLQVDAEEYYLQYCQPQVQYNLSIDENFIKQFAGELTIVNLFAVGDYIQVKDADIGLDKSIRITAFTRDLLQPYKYAITIGDKVSQNIITRVITDLEKIDELIRINDLTDVSKARRNWRSSQEVLANVFDPEGDYFSEKIKPLSIETSMLAVGAKSMQFVLQNTLIEANYQGNKNAVKVTGGTLAHYTIAEEIRTWSLASSTTALTSDLRAYYIYGKCSKTGNLGSIIFSTTQVMVEEDANYFHFLIGVLNSVEGGVRAVALTYGTTTVNGRFIKTGRIQSGDGKTYFDLDNSEIGGNIKFLSSDGATIDIEGELVKTIVKVDVEYALHSSDKTPPAEGSNLWKTNADEWSEGRYLWQRLKTYYSNKNPEYSNVAMIQGKEGRGIEKVTEWYYHSTSYSGLEGDTWGLVTPTPTKGKYIWAYTHILYTDGSEHSTTPIMASGYDGKDGDDAVPPIIIDGYWAFWNKAQNKYIKSEFSAIGDDGYSPKIVDGYWHEWDPTANPPGYRDTGIKAEGKDGKDGEIDYSVLAQYDQSLAITDQFGTTIDGGLVTAVTMLLREAGSENNTAGISGIQGSQNEKPAVWAGGTHGQAIAVSYFLNKIANGEVPTSGEYDALAKIALLHDGGAKLGDFLVERSGRIVMANPDTGKPRLVFNATDIPALTELEAGSIFNGSDSSYSTTLNSANHTTTIISNLDVTRDGSTIEIKRGASTLWAEAGLQPIGSGMDAIIPSVILSIDLYKDGVLVNNLGWLTATPMWGTIHTANPLPLQTYTLNGMRKGRYSIIAKYTKGEGIINGQGEIAATTIDWEYNEQNIRWFQFGLNGMMAFFTNNHIYFTESQGLSVRGKTDIPGILLAGRVKVGGGFENSWGAKSDFSRTASNGSTGNYIVYHSVNHAKYSVQVTLEGEGTATISDCSTTYFRVTTRNMLGTLTNIPFSFSILGDNYKP